MLIGINICALMLFVLYLKYTISEVWQFNESISFLLNYYIAWRPPTLETLENPLNFTYPLKTPLKPLRFRGKNSAPGQDKFLHLKSLKIPY